MGTILLFGQVLHTSVMTSPRAAVRASTCGVNCTDSWPGSDCLCAHCAEHTVPNLAAQKAIYCKVRATSRVP